MSTKLALTSGGSGAPFPEHVFASWVYTGTSAAGAGPTQNIVNNINLSGAGGMVWTKHKTLNSPHILTDTVRGVGAQLSTSSGYEVITAYTNSFSSFNNNGYTLGTDSNGVVNNTGYAYNSWTFRRAKRFFDIVTYTGNGAARTIPHSLGVAPGFILIKQIGSTNPFYAYHRSVGAGRVYSVNSTAVSAASTTFWNNTAPTDSVFSLGVDTGNTNAASYVAYLFAHDTSADGIIQCGSYTGTGSTSSPPVSLGWEPQFLIVKDELNASNWTILDDLRGMSFTESVASYANTVGADTGTPSYIGPVPEGFRRTDSASIADQLNRPGDTYIYVAIRRPTKPPASGSAVFGIATRTSVGGGSTVTTGFRVDTFLTGVRNQNATNKMFFIDRLRGGGTNATSMASSTGQTENVFALASVNFAKTSSLVITDATNGSWDGLAGDSVLNYFLKRARNFFEVVCYLGTGANTTVQHNLKSVPELMIVKNRFSNAPAAIYAPGLAATQRLNLFATTFTTAAAAPVTDATVWNSTAPTSTAFSVGTSTDVNGSGASYVAYLFATWPGISKVGSYTGNGGTAGSAGTSQTINCGFTTGARFVLVKRTDSSGDWYFWDTARGIVSANDPRLALNRIISEVTTDDSLDPDSSGFIVNQVAATDINVTGATYIYLAIA